MEKNRKSSPFCENDGILPLQAPKSAVFGPSPVGGREPSRFPSKQAPNVARNRPDFGVPGRGRPRRFWSGLGRVWRVLERFGAVWSKKDLDFQEMRRFAIILRFYR